MCFSETWLLSIHQEMQAMLVGSKIPVMAIHFWIRSFEIAKCTARAAEYYLLYPTRDSTKPTAGHDLLAANEAFLLPCIVALQIPNLLFERFHPAFSRARVSGWILIFLDR